MQKKSLLVELGLEEIPAGYILPALRDFRKSFEQELKDAGLQYIAIEEFSSPRRIALRIAGLDIEQKDEIIERIGPAVKIAYDSEGHLSKAAQGFLRGAGAEAKDIYRVESSKGEKIAIRLEKKGKTTKELIPEMIKKGINAISFPKTMCWGSTRMQLARPLRWIICLFEEEIIDLTINNVTSSNVSYGNRFKKLVNPVIIKDVCAYEDALKTVEVIADRNERKNIIINGMVKIAEESNLEIIEDDKLIDVVTDLVEYPTAVLGSFNKTYLDLPEKIIISTLSQNQKCFALREKNGKLANKFIFTNNGNPEFEEIIKEGNEKVIAARLADAEFYYKEDTAIALENYTDKLKEVVFQKDLGSIFEKVIRIKALSGKLADILGIPTEEKSDILRCASLCKADLVTQMLGEKEFTKLQGYIGMKYAEKSGEKPEVALGIYEHYQPRGQNDGLPESKTGIIVAISDKLDTVCGIMGVDLIPTGSNDPFALRRAANGVIRIIAENSLEIDINEMIEYCYGLLIDKLPSHNNNIEKVKEFFKQRVDWYLKQQGTGYDVIESVMHLGLKSLPDLLQRASDVESFRTREDFVSLVLGFKRVSNIIRDIDDFTEVEEVLLNEEAERELWNALGKLEEVIEEKLANRRYKEIMENLVDFSSFIDKFFDDVMVNVEDEKLRKNRYNLLYKIRSKFLQVADLATVIVE